MGKNEKLNSPAKDFSLQLNGKIRLILSETEWNRAQISNDGVDEASFSLECLDADAAVNLERLDGLDLLVIEVASSNPASLRRIGLIRSQRPNLPLIVAICDADIPTTRMLIRQGVADIVALPLDRHALEEAICDALAARSTPVDHRVRLAPVISVAQSVGGIGATTVATHLAHDLGEMSPGSRGCCLIDLDLQFGNAASYLSAAARLSMEDLLEAGDRVDGQLLRTVAAAGPDGVAVIAAPEHIIPIESVDTDQLMRVIQLAREEYDYVVLDLPGNWANWTLSAIAKSDIILLIIDLSVGSLRQARRRLELFNETNIDKNRVRVIANRVEKRLFRTINMQDAADALKHEVFATIHNDFAVVQSAHDQGILVNAISRKNRVAADLRALAEQVFANLNGGRG